MMDDYISFSKRTSIIIENTLSDIVLANDYYFKCINDFNSMMGLNQASVTKVETNPNEE